MSCFEKCRTICFSLIFLNRPNLVNTPNLVSLLIREYEGLLVTVDKNSFNLITVDENFFQVLIIEILAR